WQTIFCSPVSHIHEDECNAPEFFSGAKLTLVGDGDKINPTELRKSILAEESRGVHGPQRGPISITQITEKGQVYTLNEIKELSQIAKEFNLPVHMDGARFANALVSLDCTPAEMTWKAGVDAVTFGGTKNGLMGVEGVIFFDPDKAWEFELRRKRGAHLFSKHRYLSAQMLAYLENDLWIKLANKANKSASRLIEGLKDIKNVKFLVEPKANLMFVTMPASMHRKAFAAGLEYYTWSELDGVSDDTPVLARFVVDWSRSLDDIDEFLAIMKNLV
ncbi:MAG: low specificity L-threonine aldolase, partial [Marinovum sp.]|nr:low specificity L-threonine aldolase [Marinovum sp.]